MAHDTLMWERERRSGPTIDQVAPIVAERAGT